MTIENFIPAFLNTYNRTARLYPGLLVVAPLAVLVVCLYGTQNLPLSTMLSVFGFCGIAYALGRISRDAGKRIQERLFIKWGGAPTTQMLRHRNEHFDKHTKDRFHRFLSNVLGKPLPTIETEAQDEGAADELYRAATQWLIGKTRDKKSFPLVYQENIAFGFHRNALGLRPLGLTTSSASIIWILIEARVVELIPIKFRFEKLRELPPSFAIALAFSCLMIATWVFLFTESALKRTGFSYAERLIQGCDMLTTPQKKKKISTLKEPECL